MQCLPNNGGDYAIFWKYVKSGHTVPDSKIFLMEINYSPSINTFITT